MFLQRIAFSLTKTRLSIYWRIVDDQNQILGLSENVLDTQV